MFIPLEKDNVLCLENITALYKNGSVTDILYRDGRTEKTSFTPAALKRRAGRLWAESAINGRSNAPDD